MDRKAIAGIVLVALWAAAIGVVLVVNALVDDRWNAEGGYLVAAATVLATWALSNAALERLGLTSPYRA
jgi:hypothetical protein